MKSKERREEGSGERVNGWKMFTKQKEAQRQAKAHTSSNVHCSIRHACMNTIAISTAVDIPTYVPIWLCSRYYAFTLPSILLPRKS